MMLDAAFVFLVQEVSGSPRRKNEVLERGWAPSLIHFNFGDNSVHEESIEAPALYAAAGLRTERRNSFWRIDEPFKDHRVVICTARAAGQEHRPNPCLVRSESNPGIERVRRYGRSPQDANEKEFESIVVDAIDLAVLSIRSEKVRTSRHVEKKPLAVIVPRPENLFAFVTKNRLVVDACSKSLRMPASTPYQPRNVLLISVSHHDASRNDM